MPKIPPRESVRESALYRSAMAAQHAAYQLMRDVPADRKADAAKLHASLVHATAWAVSVVDPDVAPGPKAAAQEALAAAVASAAGMLEPLAPLANDAGIPDALQKAMEELRAAPILPS